jgi:hypothetical protein
MKEIYDANPSSWIAVEKYNPDLEYKLKEKEDEDNRTSDDTNTTMDVSMDSANTASKMTIPNCKDEL